MSAFCLEPPTIQPSTPGSEIVSTLSTLKEVTKVLEDFAYKSYPVSKERLHRLLDDVRECQMFSIFEGPLNDQPKSGGPGFHD